MELVFVMGGAYRRVFIKGREASLICAETGYQPITVNLEKLDKANIKKIKQGEKIVKELKELKTEEDLAKDVTKDLQSQGWRLVKRV